MTLGAGKYDAECTKLMVDEHAEAVLVIVIGGHKRGSGFACQSTPQITLAIPQLLRGVADDIERSMRENPKS